MAPIPNATVAGVVDTKFTKLSGPITGIIGIGLNALTFAFTQLYDRFWKFGDKVKAIVKEAVEAKAKERILGDERRMFEMGELKGELKAELKAELKMELRAELKAELEAELKAELRVKLDAKPEAEPEAKEGEEEAMGDDEGSVIMRVRDEEEEEEDEGHKANLRASLALAAVLHQSEEEERLSAPGGHRGPPAELPLDLTVGPSRDGSSGAGHPLQTEVDARGHRVPSDEMRQR
ncbi:MAG: hypothetical protein Q9213_006687 [Squamulea squamosa]